MNYVVLKIVLSFCDVGPVLLLAIALLFFFEHNKLLLSTIAKI